MEAEQSGPEKSKETIAAASSPEEQLQQQQSTTLTSNLVRSYECTFCKRGFTNAQALGGHMNIHRKDKAKFKPSSTSAAVSTTSAAVAGPFSISPAAGHWFSPQDDKKPLSLFGHDTDVPRNITHQENEMIGDSPEPLPEPEVDLELRLGHVEPPSESSSGNKSKTTRKFF